jgi:hypothetical protein
MVSTTYIRVGYSAPRDAGSLVHCDSGRPRHLYSGAGRGCIIDFQRLKTEARRVGASAPIGRQSDQRHRDSDNGREKRRRVRAGWPLATTAFTRALQLQRIARHWRWTERRASDRDGSDRVGQLRRLSARHSDDPSASSWHWNRGCR